MGRLVEIKQRNMSDLALQIDTCMQSITDELTTLEGCANTLKASWTGEAQQAYTEAQAEWDASIAQLTEILRVHAMSVRVIAAGFATIEAAATARWF